jgi:hypothetical protein
MKYTVFASNGKITKLLDCDNIEQQLAAGEAYLDGWFSDTEYYVAQKQPVLMPPKPSEYCIFDYDTRQWFDPRTPETQWSIVRTERNKRLQRSDWTQLPDVPLVTKEVWAAYRQALRDVPAQAGYPQEVVWPNPPA